MLSHCHVRQAIGVGKFPARLKVPGMFFAAYTALKKKWKANAGLYFYQIVRFHCHIT
jgi:hypothetical protein